MIGIDVEEPEEKCNDPNCPFHGHLKVRGIIIKGKVVSTSMQKTVVIEREKLHYVPKYERYEKRTSRYKAH
ncbi:MAG TPA: 30S ribosomal protein S17, partial [Thermoplasmata archaeon]|nr:30S ribosomal protein S17 [Thermoplasmata archaeon]